jgi:hypothetical protein
MSVYEIKVACWWLKNNEHEIHMKFPSHVEVWGNKRADKLASDAVDNGIDWHATVRPPVGRFAE